MTTTQEFEDFKKSIHNLVIDRGEETYTFTTYNLESARAYARRVSKIAGVIPRTKVVGNSLFVNISNSPRKKFNPRMFDAELNTRIVDAIKAGTGAHDFKCENISPEVMRCRILRFARENKTNVVTRRFGNTLTLFVGQKRQIKPHNTKFVVTNLKTNVSYTYTRHEKLLKFAVPNEKKRLFAHLNGSRKHYKTELFGQINAVIQNLSAKEIFNEKVLKIETHQA